MLLGFVFHDDVIKWKHIPRYWPFVRGITGLNREAGDLRRHRAHYDVIVMQIADFITHSWMIRNTPLLVHTMA